MATNDSKQPAAAVSGEGLLSPGLVCLFGRPFTGLNVGDLAAAATMNNQLATSIRAAAADGTKPSLARIYGFSALGSYHKLAEPSVFLVFAPGEAVPEGSYTPDVRTELGGIDRKGKLLTDGMQMWVCDQMDMAVRIDIRTGWVKDLLLDENAGADPLRRAGTTGRDANLVGRDSNLVGRDSNLIGRGR